MNLAAFQHSHFLQALGWAIANSIWQAGILWFLYHVVISSYTNASSKIKTNLSSVLLFSSFIWFGVTFLNKFISLQSARLQPASKQLIFSSDVYSHINNLSLRSFIYAIGNTLPYLSAAYLLLLLIFSVKLINSYRNTVHIKHNGLHKPYIEWKLFLEKVALQMNFSKKVSLWFSKYVDVPATIGFFKPVILIPLASLNQLTSDQLEAIILHELAHIKRNDYLINLFISLVETILFFNPFIVLLSKIIKKERENCCDDFVLQYQYDRHSYASALLSLEKFRTEDLQLALTATSGKKQLLFRIKRIMEIKHRNNNLNYGQKLLALLLVTGIICSIAWLAPTKKSDLLYSNKASQSQTLKNFKAVRTDKTEFAESTKKQEAINLITSSRLTKGKQSVKSESLKRPDSPESDEASLYNPEPSADAIENVGFNESQNPMQILSDINKTSGAFTDAVNFVFKFSPKDLNFLKDVNIDLDKLRDEIQINNQALSTLEWKNIQQQIFANFPKITRDSLNITVTKNRIRSLIDTLEKRPIKNSQKNFKFTFKGDKAPTWNIPSGSGDVVLFKKSRNSSNSNGDRPFYIETRENNFLMPAPTPVKRKGRITRSQNFNCPQVLSIDNKVLADLSLTQNEKLPPKQLVVINYQNGSVTINGETLNATELKKHQAILKKLLSDDMSQPLEIRFEN